MQADTKCIRNPRSTESSRSTRPAVSALSDDPPESPGSHAGGSPRLPASAFSEAFVAKLRLVLQLLDQQGEEPAPDTEAEAMLSGPLTVERVHGRGGGRLWAVVKAAEPVAAGGRAAALCHTRGEALRLAAVLPSVPKLNPYHLSDRPTHLGWPLHRNRCHVGHVSRLARVEGSREARARSQALLAHLHVARYLAAHPEALAQVIESVGPEALPTLGRALARRVEAALEEPEA